MPLRLRPLRLDDEREAGAAHAELAADDFVFLLDWDPHEAWSEYVQRTKNHRRGIGLPEDRVPGAFLVADVDGALVGRVSIRFQLNAFLAQWGGHIGYGVRPAFRRRGFASEILRQALIIIRAEGVERVLVTCEDSNNPSARVIEALGGQLEDVRTDPEGKRMRRYWIA